MSYTKTQWVNDQAPAINATNLNKIEQGIYDNDSAITTANANIGDLSDLETTTQTDIVSAINELESEKQDNLTAGNNIQISNNVISATDTTYSVATTSANGLMSASDKIKLDTIIESGSNASGYYIKYSDGTMICYAKVSVNLDISQAVGSLYKQSLQRTINYPASFASAPVVTIAVENDSDYCFCWVYGIQRTVSAITRVDLLRPVAGSGMGTMCYTAVGRWK